MRKQDKQLEDLSGKIEGLTREVAGLRAERDAARDEIGLLGESLELREQIETQKIEAARLKEDHDREVREVKHMVGLEKKRAEFDKDSAIREAKLEVREEALDDKLEAFTEKLELVQGQFEQQIKYLKDDIIAQVFKRLPVVEVNKTLEFSGAANGAKDDA